MVLVCVSIMTTVAVLNIHYRGPATHVMSDRVKKVKSMNKQLSLFGSLIVFRIFCMNFFVACTAPYLFCMVCKICFTN